MRNIFVEANKIALKMSGPINFQQLTDKKPRWGYNVKMKNEIMQTVVETPGFIKQANRCMDKVSWNGFIEHIAANPLAGDLIVGTGGARKIRWTGDHKKGKSGGARIIYHYHGQSMPIFHCLWKKSTG